MSLPLPLVAALAVLLLAREYRTGTDFVHDTNYKFVWFFHSVVFGLLAGAAMLPGVIALGVSWRRLHAAARWRFSVGLAAAVALAAAAVGCAATAFQAGKSRAYAGVNAPLLAADCSAMVAALASPGNVRQSDFVEGTDPSVPPYLRSLRPRYVSLRSDQVEVVMAHDYLSGAYHESFIVPLGPLPDPGAYAAEHRMAVINTQPPVFRFPAPQ